MTHTAQILAACDAGQSPAAIAAALPAKLADVYRVLRLHRPNRLRSPRRRTSTIRPKALALRAEGMSVARIAALCVCSEALVYRMLREG